MEEKIKEILKNEIEAAERKGNIQHILDISDLKHKDTLDISALKEKEVIYYLKDIYNKRVQEIFQYGAQDMTRINNTLEAINILITNYSSYYSKEELILIDKTLCTINYRFTSSLLKDDFIGFDNIVKKLTFSLLKDGRLSSDVALDEERNLLSANFKPLSLEDLQEGDYFGVCAYDLLPVVLYNDDDNLSLIVPSTINYNEILKDSILLFKYLGDNKCAEFYTGYEVELGMLRRKTYAYTEKDKCLFGKDLNRVRKNPLCIYGESHRNKLYFFDEELKKRLISQQGTKVGEIKSVIFAMAENNRALLAERINRLIEEGYEVAKTEYDFELSLAEFERKIAAKKELKKELKIDKLENYSFEAGV